MGISYNPSIVTEGLVLGLDPQSPRFYNYKGRSVAFDGTGDYLSVPSNSDFSFGTGDFTIECFFYLSANTGDYRSFIGIPHSSGQVGFRFGNSDAYNSLLQAYIIGATAAQVYSINVSQSDLIGGWHHAAFTRSGTTCRIFLDGIQYNVGSGLNPVSFPNASFTDSTDITNNDIINIGRAASDLTLFNGFISNLRIIKGTALYTANFTPPTEPLTAVTNTKLLTCQGNTISDASSSAHSITPNGNVVIDYNGPFSGSGWTDLTNRGNSGTLTNGPVFIPGGPFNNSGGSVQFDGSGDYLTVSSSDFAFGTGDCTVEGWGYVTSHINYRVLATTRIDNGGFSDAWHIGCDVNGTLLLYSNAFNLQSASNAVPTNQWFHWAFTRNNGTGRLFVNGEIVASGSVTNNYTRTLLGIGDFPTSQAEPWNGHISNLRVLKGQALYTENFTPPTGPLEAVDDTVLLTCQGGAITDNGPNSHAITVNNDAEAITASAFEFDGSNDAVSLTNINPTSGASYSAWININGSNSNYGAIFANWSDGGGGRAFWIGTNIGASSTIQVYFNGSLVGSITSLPLNSWMLLTITHTGSVCKAYINAIEKFSSSSTLTASTNNTSIGYDITRSNYPFKGNISQVLIYNRALTAAEVQQNYNTLRGRYGI